jgi:hypothetical protein
MLRDGRFYRRKSAPAAETQHQPVPVSPSLPPLANGYFGRVSGHWHDAGGRRLEIDLLGDT